MGSILSTADLREGAWYELTGGERVRAVRLRPAAQVWFLETAGLERSYAVDPMDRLRLVFYTDAVGVRQRATELAGYGSPTREDDVREGGAQLENEGAHPCGTDDGVIPVDGDGADVVCGEDRVDQGEVIAGPHLFQVPADHGLIRFAHHCGCASVASTPPTQAAHIATAL
jgi:hypothetical protein